MLGETKQQAISKLIGARDELEDALNLTAARARYDPVVLPQAMREELSAMREGLDRIILSLKQTQ
ncbi:MAG TPA: hypothetical protein VJ999_09455 [Candidatus Sulfotelmatobacter sp.]|nr:hypothetical protein [Candidatus Sulfotelmatobacter sp.]